MKNIGIFNTSIGSGNIGDHIIMDSIFSEIAPLIQNMQRIHFSSHDAHLYNALKLQRSVEFNLLCGTNCLGSKMWYRPSWAVNLFTAGFLKPTVTLGVGWGAYQDEPDFYTKKLLHKTLISDGFLSVRDDYTKEKLLSAGFNNVLNTACLTMWGLTKEKCIEIKTKQASKSRSVIYTLTDYAADFDKDFLSIKILLENYEEVLIWIQGSQDYNYFKEIVRNNNLFFSKHRNVIKVIPPVLSTYDQILEKGEVDYVGTRLHGGIRALQKGVRTIIIGVDNRALEKKKDFNLPVISRDEVEGLDNMINSPYEIDISLPHENIEKFKEWFSLYSKRFEQPSDFSYL